MQRAILLLWPSFMIACLATAAFFSVFDPFELKLHGVQLFEDKRAAYTLFMLVTWALGALNTGIVLLLEKPGSEINGFCALPAKAGDEGDDPFSLPNGTTPTRKT
ncbi:hypothetical protein [Paludibacterium paludis]|uniref:Uncharacterized protein n=1 Tax=Paludibacterium paludis TaxID=1225769 RepID=A0A918UBL4_9NEIS|nr:hypothetical protein [Paludibacterium paludis]GGY25036.1 hypothetical protein GCM10011289_30870 [Paludibacterium paludis]